LEAMALGCPVVSSRGGSLPEVLGDAALFVDPDDLDQFSATLADLIADDAMRDRMVRAGKDRAAQFTWRTAVDQFDGIIRDFIASNGDRVRVQGQS
ncbi:MAG: glycosyltransferase, partial [Hyphomicrobiales bacterium]